jgi:hypothetical protein
MRSPEKVPAKFLQKRPPGNGKFNKFPSNESNEQKSRSNVAQQISLPRIQTQKDPRL